MTVHPEPVVTSGPMRPRRSRAAARRGFAYAELIVAIALLAVALVPAMQAVQGGTRIAGEHRWMLANQQRLKARMEEVLARPFRELDDAAVAAGNSTSATIAAYSDASGSATAPAVMTTVYRYDGTAATSSDTGLLWVKVYIDSAQALNTLKSR